MSVESNKALARRFWEEIWNRGRIGLVDAWVVDDFRFRGSLGATVEGREAFHRYFNAVRSAFPDFSNSLHEMVAEGDTVMARVTFSGTHRGEIFGTAPTGRRVEYAAVAILKFRLGKITEGWVLGDLYSLLVQIGAVESADPGPLAR